MSVAKSEDKKRYFVGFYKLEVPSQAYLHKCLLAMYIQFRRQLQVIQIKYYLFENVIHCCSCMYVHR